LNGSLLHLSRIQQAKLVLDKKMQQSRFESILLALEREGLRN
jgi:hypothetical protein